MSDKFAQAKLFKRRIRQVQNRAKLAGVIYTLGTAMLLLCAACVLGVDGSCLHTNKSGGIVLPVLAFYLPLLKLINDSASWCTQLTLDCVISVLYALILLIIAVALLRCLSKLNWLFKRRASYINGFNRNAYAMDTMGKCYSVSLTVSIVFGLFIVLLSGETAKLNVYAYMVLGFGVAVHILGGILSGGVTLFTMGKHVQEVVRPNGLFIHFIRNVCQMAAIALIANTLMKKSLLHAAVVYSLGLIFPAESSGAFDVMALMPGIAELVMWCFLSCMIGYACSTKEFNREGMGMQNVQRFTWLTFFILLAMGGMMLLNIFGWSAAAQIDSDMLFAVVVAGVACLLNAIFYIPIKLDDEDSLHIDNQQYNNTII